MLVYYVMQKRYGAYLLVGTAVFIIILVFLFIQPFDKSQNAFDNVNNGVEEPQSSIKEESESNNTSENNFLQSNEINWNFNFDSKQWQVNGNPPECPEPLVFPAPANVNLASGILYPGQVRGGDYKPHGGFRFDNLDSNSLDVYAPIEANLFKAARHSDSGEIQYSLYFINDCGIMYKLDHLLQLTDKFESVLNNIPMGGDGDSRTTEIRPIVFVAKGEHIATKVGFESNKNIFFDFGVYDLREKNGVNYDSSFRAKYGSTDEYAVHALCWLDNLEESEKDIVKKLPGAGTEGKTSDYCK